MSKESKGKKYDNTNTGAAWKAERKTKKHPHYKGTLNVKGKEYWISIWKNKDAKGTKQPELRIALTKKKK